MASFIGSNLQSLHYNFKHKIAGSTVENPLKIYSGSVNPSNLPAPTSTEWKEIKNQNFIDRLSQQDGNTVVETTSNSVLGNVVSTNAPCDGMMNIEIGGLTLKNEVKLNEVIENKTYSTSSTTNVSLKGGLIQHVPLKPNTKYTFIPFVAYSNNTLKYVYIGLNYRNTSNVQVPLIYLSPDKWNKPNVFTTSSDILQKADLFLGGSSGSITINSMKFLLLEGDWSNYNIPYFDGIKSVGEAEGNKIEGLTCGKNLCSGMEIGAIDVDNGLNITNENYMRTISKIKINLIKDYIIYINNYNYIISNIFFYDNIGNYISQRLTQKTSNLVLNENIIPQNTSSIKFVIRRQDSAKLTENDIITIQNNTQLEEGTTVTPYEPYEEDKINILTTEPLRGLPNGVRDIASGDTVERRIRKDALDGSESGWKNYSLGTNERYVSFYLEVENGKPNSEIITDKILPTKKSSNLGIMECVYAGVNNNILTLFITILKSKLSTADLAGFKSWLQTNPTTVYYELAEPTIEKLPQPLTLQSFANGTLQVNTAIPPYIKEYHTTNPDDQGVMQYQSGTTGLSQAFLTQIPLTSITNDIFGGSLPALKSSYKLTSNCDISAYGSGNNNGVETNNISYKVWNGTEYILLNTGTSNVVSNINNILNNSNYVVDNNIYILMHTLPASDTIKSQINLDYFNAFINIARQPDNVIIPDTVKNTYIPTNYSIFVKVACLKTNDKKVITQYYKDASNYIELNIENNKVNFLKCINGVVTTLSSNVLDYNKFQVLGIVAQQQNTGMKLSVLKNNSECEHFSNTDVNILSVATEWKIGHDVNIVNQLDGFVVDYQFTDKTFTNTECEVMLKGRNTTGDITYDSFVRDYQNGKIQSGFILPNNKYKIIGQVKLYYNDSYSRTVENCEFVTKDDENKVELIGMAELVRVD